MTDEQKRKYAKAVMLGQRIFLNNQAMLNSLSRSNTVNNLNRNKALKKKFRDSLNDMSECINDFQEITNIDLGEAKTTMEKSFEALDNDDFSTLYGYIQKLYRDNYLSKIISLLEE